MNNKYKIIVESPLLRPGIKIETEVSEKYLVDVLNLVMNKIRTFNSQEKCTPYVDSEKKLLTERHVSVNAECKDV